MRIVTADVLPLFECVEGCPRCSRVFVSEDDPLVDVVADRLHTPPSLVVRA